MLGEQSSEQPAGTLAERAKLAASLNLTPENKNRTLAEIYRVLRPGGELHVSDWEKAQNLTMRLAFLMVQLLDGFETTAENVRGRLPELFRHAGFKEVQETSRSMTMFGTLSLYLAKRPV